VTVATDLDDSGRGRRPTPGPIGDQHDVEGVDNRMKDPNVLVPIDFSEPSRRALRAAGHWVRIFGGRIVPMHACEAVTDLDGFHFYGPETSISGDLPTVERGLKALLDDLARQDVDAEHCCRRRGGDREAGPLHRQGFAQ
jgi:hypothetical protein